MSGSGIGWYMFLMPTVGASIHIIQKFLFECRGDGEEIDEKFEKPLFFTWCGSFGMFINFLLSALGNFQSYKKRFFTNRSFIRPFLLLSISTFFNLLTGVLSNISSLYLNYSVSLMLRSSTLIFGALISTFYLHRPLLHYQSVGVFFTIIAIIFVGLAALFSGSKTTHRSAPTYMIAFHITIRVMSKSVQAISMIMEEKIMTKYNMTPTELSGFSGIWSFIFSSCLLLPFENSYDTFLMIKNTLSICVLSIASIAVFAIWNVLALNITKKASAVARMVFDQLTIVVVWVVQLIIHWIVVGTEYEKRYGRTGEEWTKWSWLQLFGFFVMVIGACIYQKIIEIPCIHYSEPLRKQSNELSIIESSFESALDNDFPETEDS